MVELCSELYLGSNFDLNPFGADSDEEGEAGPPAVSGYRMPSRQNSADGAASAVPGGLMGRVQGGSAKNTPRLNGRGLAGEWA